MMTNVCPCGMNSYELCCEPLHLELKVANTAEQLMRSRYSAFAYQLANYLLNTRLAKYHSPNEYENITKGFKATKWLNLQIIHQGAKKQCPTDEVEFKSLFSQKKVIFEMHARSLFIFQNQKWFYTNDRFCKLQKMDN